MQDRYEIVPLPAVDATIALWEYNGSYSKIQEYRDICHCISVDPFDPLTDKIVHRKTDNQTDLNTYKIIGNEIQVVYRIYDNDIVITLISVKDKD
ncbi:MAG: hypothetical protein LBO69_08990 [Ignavibacteria bacterium]|jgi:hypothetical protein|nr:hypothetical protein [Ignavibacteria bacterium]